MAGYVPAPALVPNPNRLPHSMRVIKRPHDIEVRIIRHNGQKYKITTDYTDLNEFLIDWDDNMKKPRSMRPVFVKLFEFIRELNKNTFNSQSDPSDIIGDLWEPLSPDYERWKKENYPPRKTLQLTFDLKRSMIYKNHPLAIREYGSRSNNHQARFGTRVEYADEHEYGVTFSIGSQEVHIPPRPFMPPPSVINNMLKHLSIVYIKSGYDRRSLNTGRRRGKALASKSVNPFAGQSLIPHTRKFGGGSISDFYNPNL